ncbi:MAG TPA: recombinase RecA [Armatimonadota bacterium]|jgi:recombination protein RecA
MAKTDPIADKSKALELALGSIRKQYGDGSVMRLGEEPLRLQVSVIPTGSLTLDIALGVGGLPKGRIVEIYGQEGSGKTTLAQHIIAETQKMGGVAAFIDAEHAFNREYAENLGINLDELLVSQPDTGEQALDICDTLVRSGAVDCIVIDSVAALVPSAELQGDMGDTHVGLQARLMSQALRKLAGNVSTAGTLVVFINQIREKIGVMFGNPETTPGGRALKFWSSVRLELQRRATIKSGTDILGSRVNVKVVKNKVAPPFRNAEFDIIFGRGFSQEGCIIDEATNLNITERTGSWYSYGSERLGQGRENAVQFILDHPEVARDLENQVRAAHGLPNNDCPLPSVAEVAPAEAEGEE